MAKLIDNILKYCPNVKKCEFFHSDNTLAIWNYKDRIQALSEVQSYLSANDTGWYGLRLIIY